MQTRKALLVLLAAPLSAVACNSVENVRPSGELPFPDAVVERADPAQPAVCAERRQRAAAGLGDGLLLLYSGTEEEDSRFHPQHHFYWLTGASVPDAVLLLAARNGEIAACRLYLPPHDPRKSLWDGPRLTPGEEARKTTGVDDIRPLPELDTDVEELLSGLEDEAAFYTFGDPYEQLFGKRDVRDAQSLLHPLQVKKDALEIEALRAAVDITQASMRDAMRVAVPGAWEFTAEAAIEGGFRRRGAEDLAFPSICGSGPNSCYLHYRANQRQLEDGDLLVMDIGARFRGYCADVTRTIPVNGRFTDRQREIYTLVYEASRRAAAVLRPGATLRDAHRVASQHLSENGIDVARFFPHGVGHGLGLEVHDAPSTRTPLEAGMVVTIEPGIYILDEELGVRIEDDYLITEDGAELLSDDIPAHPDRLEAFLADLRAD